MSRLDSIIEARGPKKLLAIDGGGIRGLIAIEFLSKIERLLRDRFNQPNLVLADDLDYVAGTSTGAIIATLISLGYSIDEVHGFYRTGRPRCSIPMRSNSLRGEQRVRLRCSRA